MASMVGKDINPDFNLDLLIKRWDDALKVRKMAVYAVRPFSHEGYSLPVSLERWSFTAI
jgi:hypothetical protein